MQQVREVMTARPVGLPATAPLTQAAKTMEEQNVGDVLVLSDTGVQGIVTDRDIVVRALAKGRNPETTEVADIASEVLATVQASEPVERATQVMREKSVRRLPVYEGDEVVGVVSIGDLARAQDPDSALAGISKAQQHK